MGLFLWEKSGVREKKEVKEKYWGKKKDNGEPLCRPSKSRMRKSYGK